ncbi:hypothetical protein CDAR_475671 [Caerostris darwini]|uniref:Uncharacterized protein n=1 Tax=Caerostris darwini TaxID=1538125 RepID=A0AAV4P7L7_9ARAC|nr:hypothetical protein CDAR_475671 [Caerostris darwini]
MRSNTSLDSITVFLAYLRKDFVALALYGNIPLRKGGCSCKRRSNNAGSRACRRAVTIRAGPTKRTPLCLWQMTSALDDTLAKQHPRPPPSLSQFSILLYYYLDSDVLLSHYVQENPGI